MTQGEVLMVGENEEKGAKNSIEYDEI